MSTIINGSSPSITFSDSTTQASAGLTAASPTIASGVLTFPNATTQSTAFNSSTAVTSVTAGTGISVSASTGGVTITNTAPATTPGIAKAWASFNGSTATIIGSFNVSSITRVATGQYTINFTTAMSNTNFADFGGASKWNDGINTIGYTLVPYTIGSLKTTTSGTIYVCAPSGGGNTDPTYCTYVAFNS